MKTHDFDYGVKNNHNKFNDQDNFGKNKQFVNPGKNEYVKKSVRKKYMNRKN